jgi:RND superfamily putative drug exporter
VRSVARYRWAVLATWLVLLAVAGIGALGLGDRLSGGGWYAPGSQSSRAVAALQEGLVGRGPTTVTLLTRDQRHSSGDPEFEDRAEDVVAHVSGLPGLRVRDVYGWGAAEGAARTGFVGTSGRTTVTTLGLQLPDGEARRELPGLQAALDERYRDQGLHVSLRGAAPLGGESTCSPSTDWCAPSCSCSPSC